MSELNGKIEDVLMTYYKGGYGLGEARDAILEAVAPQPPESGEGRGEAIKLLRRFVDCNWIRSYENGADADEGVDEEKYFEVRDEAIMLLQEIKSRPPAVEEVAPAPALDLEAIEATFEARGAFVESLQAIPALIAEVRRLRTPSQGVPAPQASETIRNALESALAGVWDGHYSGTGVTVGYAQAVDKEVKAALKLLDAAPQASDYREWASSLEAIRLKVIGNIPQIAHAAFTAGFRSAAPQAPAVKAKGGQDHG